MRVFTNFIFLLSILFHKHLRCGLKPFCLKSALRFQNPRFILIISFNPFCKSSVFYFHQFIFDKDA